MDLSHLVGVLRRLSENPSVVSATLDLGLRRITVEVRLPDLAPLLESAADEYRAMGWRVNFDLSGDSPTVVVRAPEGRSVRSSPWPTAGATRSWRSGPPRADLRTSR